MYPWDWQNRSLQFLFAFKKISLALTQGITVAQKHKGQIIYISLKSDQFFLFDVHQQKPNRKWSRAVSDKQFFVTLMPK